MTEVEWTNDLVKQLISEYRARPVLWDMSHELYRVQTAKYEAYMELANMFECDVIDLRKKLNSIFASHRREKAKVRGGARSSWYLYPHMSFLPSHLEMGEAPGPGRKKRREELSEEEPSSDIADEGTFDNQLHEELIIKQEVVPVDSYVRPKKTRTVAHKPRLTKVTRRPVTREVSTSQLDSRLLETLKLLRKSELSRKKDECDSFGEYIAVSLRKHDERTQSMIKQAINNILFEQEMKKYSATQYVVISGMDENPLTLGDNDGADK